MHNSLMRELVKFIKEADYPTLTHNLGRILTDSLTRDQLRSLHDSDHSASNICQPDAIIDLGADNQDFTRGRVQESRILCDAKTTGVTKDYKKVSKLGHISDSTENSAAPCLGVKTRQHKVHRDYVAKSKKLDRIVQPALSSQEVGPIQGKLESFDRVHGLVFGPFGEISPDIRKLLQPAVKRIAVKKRGKMVINNLTLAHTEATVYDMIRRRLGLLAHAKWFEIMLRSLNLVGLAFSAESQPDFTEMIIGVSEEVTQGDLVADGELGI